MDVARRSIGTVLLGALLLAALPAQGAGRHGGGESLTVVVKKTSVRRDRQFYAPAVGEASYGETLAVLGREGDWVRVTAGSVTGWVHASAVTEKKVELQSRHGAAPGPASDEDVALAGKGFNPQVEKEYRKKNPGANFGAVDRMEKLTVSEQEIAAFVRAGGLTPRGGGK